MTAVYAPRIIGVDNIPREGRVLIAPNHTSTMDGPLLLTALNRPTHVLTKTEVFVPVISTVMHAGGALETRWHSPDRNVLLRSRELLLEEKAVALFPEGSRSRGQFDWVKDGVSYLVAHTGAPIVPVAMLGTRFTGQPKSWITRPSQPVTIVIGEPILAASVSDGTFSGTRSELRTIGQRLRIKLERFVQEAAQQYNIDLPEDDVSQEDETHV